MSDYTNIILLFFTIVVLLYLYTRSSIIKQAKEAQEHFQDIVPPSELQFTNSLMNTYDKMIADEKLEEVINNQDATERALSKFSDNISNSAGVFRNKALKYKTNFDDYRKQRIGEAYKTIDNNQQQIATRKAEVEKVFQTASSQFDNTISKGLNDATTANLQNKLVDAVNSETSNVVSEIQNSNMGMGPIANRMEHFQSGGSNYNSWQYITEASNDFPVRVNDTGDIVCPMNDNGRCDTNYRTANRDDFSKITNEKACTANDFNDPNGWCIRAYRGLANDTNVDSTGCPKGWDIKNMDGEFITCKAPTTYFNSECPITDNVSKIQRSHSDAVKVQWSKQCSAPYPFRSNYPNTIMNATKLAPKVETKIQNDVLSNVARDVINTSKSGLRAYMYELDTKYYMYGTWIGRDIEVERIMDAKDGSKIYVAFDNPYVKVVKTADINVGTVGYYKQMTSSTYKAEIENLTEEKLNAYSRTTGNTDAYRVKGFAAKKIGKRIVSSVLTSLNGALPIHNLKGSPSAFVVLEGFLRLPSETTPVDFIKFKLDAANINGIQMFVQKHYDDAASSTFVTVNQFMKVLEFSGSGSQAMRESMRVDSARMVTYRIQYYKNSTAGSDINLQWSINNGAFTPIDPKYYSLDEVPLSSCFWNKTQNGYDEFQESYNCFGKNTKLQSVIDTCCNDKNCKSVSYSYDNGGCYKKGERTGFNSNKAYSGYTKQTGAEEKTFSWDDSPVMK